ncbi:MAG: hypothetical protein ACKOEV_15085, partial [Cytophagales bacterium]
ASDLIGQHYVEKLSEGASLGTGSISNSKSVSIELEKIVRPEQIVQLKTGGPANEFITEAYVHRPGDPFVTGLNHLKMKFRQNYSI